MVCFYFFGIHMNTYVQRILNNIEQNNISQGPGKYKSTHVVYWPQFFDILFINILLSILQYLYIYVFTYSLLPIYYTSLLILLLYCIYYIDISYTHTFFRQQKDIAFHMPVYRVSTDDQFLKMTRAVGFPIAMCTVPNLDLKLKYL